MVSFCHIDAWGGTTCGGNLLPPYVLSVLVRAATSMVCERQSIVSFQISFVKSQQRQERGDDYDGQYRDRHKPPRVVARGLPPPQEAQVAAIFACSSLGDSTPT